MATVLVSPVKKNSQGLTDNVIWNSSDIQVSENVTLASLLSNIITGISISPAGAMTITRADGSTSSFNVTAYVANNVPTESGHGNIWIPEEGESNG